MPKPPPKRAPSGFLAALRRLAGETFGLTASEQTAILVVLAMLFLGCLVRYGRLLGVSA
jgi:hypothetical protein